MRNKKDVVRQLVRDGKLNYIDKTTRLEVYKTGKLPKGYSIHHIVPKGQGGSGMNDNLIILPDWIHRRVHFADRMISKNCKDIRKTKQYWIDLVIDSIPSKSKNTKKILTKVLTEGYQSVTFKKRARGER